MNIDGMYSISMISDKLNLSRSFLYKAIGRKTLSHYKIGSRVLVSENQIQEFLENHKKQAENT